MFFLVELGCSDLLCKLLCLSVGLTYTLVISLLSTLNSMVLRKLNSVLDISYLNLMLGLYSLIFFKKLSNSVLLPFQIRKMSSLENR